MCLCVGQTKKKCVLLLGINEAIVSNLMISVDGFGNEIGVRVLTMMRK